MSEIALLCLGKTKRHKAMNFGEHSPCSVDTANGIMVEWVKKTPMWNRVKSENMHSGAPSDLQGP